MQGSIDRKGSCILEWNIQGDKFLSPDGTSHCLPCEHCGDPQWCALNVVSVICERCALSVDGTPDEINATIARANRAERLKRMDGGEIEATWTARDPHFGEMVDNWLSKMSKEKAMP
jgi:hypothetical protein